MFYVKIFCTALLAILLWSAIAIYGALSGWWIEPIASPKDSRAFMDASIKIINEENRGNVSFILIENGTIYDEYFVSFKEDKINRNTLFPTASMSKWVSAYGVMKLVENGKIDLDKPVSGYLTRWQLPSSEFDNDKVTVRHLLAHTSGLVDGLGFGDYEPDETLPSLEESLAQPRASNGRKAITLGHPPGTEWDYSGGGYLILQLILEEVSGMKFSELMQQTVFDPIGMSRSTYDYQGNFDNASSSYDSNGNPATLYKYAASAATGLSSSASDLTKFALIQVSNRYKNSPLGIKTVRSMRQPHGRKLGFDIWGLGTMLYAPTINGDLIFGHDGANDPAINSTVRINPENGDAIIMLVTGHKLLASLIGYEWTLWQTGYPDFLMVEKAIKSALLPAISGALIVILVLIAVIVMKRRRKIGL